ncbi:SGNH/GDSL hydrolase family protein [Kribbella swartbergensis]
MISRLRRFTTALLLIALVALAGGGAEAGSSAVPAALQTTGQLHVVALGDSVSSGTNCGCVAFPSVYGDLLHDRTGAAVSVTNLGLGGQDSTDLLNQLDRPDSRTERATGTADVVLITIGANDFGDHHANVTSGQCPTDCVAEELARLTSNIQRILTRVHTLRGRLPITILVTGYWNVFEDGEVARRAFPATGRAATDRLTLRVNSVIAAAARTGDATYVDIYTPFEDSPADVTTLLASDGDHPNAAGHTLIARLLYDATPNLLAASSHQGG